MGDYASNKQYEQHFKIQLKSFIKLMVYVGKEIDNKQGEELIDQYFDYFVHFAEPFPEIQELGRLLSKARKQKWSSDVLLKISMKINSEAMPSFDENIAENKDEDSDHTNKQVLQLLA